ncbi:MAG: phosphoribosylformylglycinamidine synthase I [Phycisphaerae bacterium]
MATVRVIVLRAPGINCDEETACAWQLAGARPERIHVKQLTADPAPLKAAQILTLPGGFSYGDDIAGGRILGNQLRHHLGAEIAAFLERGGLLLGICNGFQVLVRMGLLPGPDCPAPVSLTLNDSGRFEARWVHLLVESDGCPFLKQGETLHLPVAHAEGRVVTAGGAQGATPQADHDRVALRYIHPAGTPPDYPENPNGSIENVAGLLDRTGRVLGLMPHPERHVVPTQRPDRGSADSPETGLRGDCDGLRIFRRAVDHFR